jgi:proteasome lid subunit RPN8/RPN11
MLRLPVLVRSELARLVAAGYPHETCGLLVGRELPDGAAVERVVPARNRNEERARDRYLLDPDDHLRAESEARAGGRDVVGVWHSHPDHPAQPSETDRAAAWEGWAYLIASVTPQGVAELRAWRLRGEHFHEEPITP